MQFTDRLVRLVMLVAMMAASTAVFAAGEYMPDVIIIKLKAETANKVGRTNGVTATGIGSLDQLQAQFGATSFVRTVPNPAGDDPYGVGRGYTVRLAPGTDVMEAVAAYAADPNVEAASPNYYHQLYVVPNDPDYGEQWTHSVVTDRDIDTEEAWDLEVGDSSIVVGIVDTGVLFLHPDLKSSMWVNPGEDLDGDGVVWDADDMNGIDDDGNGRIDDLIGYDFIAIAGPCNPLEDCTVMDNNPSDINGHGTHVSGIVAATTGNGIGVAGVAGGMRSDRLPGVKIMALRAGFLLDDGNGGLSQDAIIAAINYATANGAHILNFSFGGGGFNSIEDAAVRNALDAGLLIYKSAGNDNNDIPDGVDTITGVVSVASLEWLGGKAPSSTFGSWVDISAPGDNIRNTYSDLGAPVYANLSGTSMASPTVAGVAALLKSHHPWLTRFDVDTIMHATVDDIYTQSPQFIGLLGSGRVNAFSALQRMTTADFDVDTTWGAVPLTVNFTDVSPNAPSGPYAYTFGDGGGASTANASNTYTSPGLFSVTFTGSGPTGPHTKTRPQIIAVLEDTVEFGSVVLAEGVPGQIPVRIHSTHPMRGFVLPFKLNGSPVVKMNDPAFVPTAALTGWTLAETVPQGLFGKSAWVLQAGTGADPLPAGDHIVGHLNVEILSGTPGQVEAVDTLTLGFSPNLYTLEASSDWVTFLPEFVGGEITVAQPPCFCECHSDPECDAVVSVLDVVHAINISFRGSPSLSDPSAGCPYNRTDASCDDVTSVIDVVKFVNVAFRGEPAAAQFCDPCP